ncbi:lectin protein kinase family protein, partial [Striga hermonthica]
MKPATVMLVFLLIPLHFLAAQVSSIDTLWRGDSLNSYSQLISARRIFTLGFHTPQDTNNTYLAVWYTDGRFPNPPVWIANRGNPFPPSSNLSLTIDANGSLVITSRRPGVESFEIYSGGPRNNLSATLLDTGNFVVMEANSSGEILWQSFDYPTDTLLPGMKLGFSQRTGRNWTLSSWFDESNPAPGAFTLEWDSNVGRLVIRRRGVIYWTSGRTRDYYENTGNFSIKEFENMISPDVFNYNYNFSSVTNGEGEYFMYTLIYIYFTPDERKIISGWRMDYNGDISDIGRGYLVMSSLCYGYESKRPGVQTGCQVWEQPTCRNQRQTFTRRAGIFSGGAYTSFYDRNVSLGPSDCRENCWDDCECIAYSHFPSSDGCRFWRGRTEFVQSPDGITDADLMYLLETAPSDKGMKTYVKIILVVLSAMVVFISGVAFFLMRKLKQVRREKELHELLTLEGYTDANEGSKSHDLRLFTYVSIKSATSNFSTDHKLGQGGFGPVYKGITSEGKDIAVKLLSRQSGQGLLEFKTELILISKLQHVNLVKLIGFSIHGNDKMIIYEYMHNKSLDFFLF